MLIPALMKLTQAGFQFYKANQQDQKARRMKPSNYVPPSVSEAINSARTEANASSPFYRRGLEKLKQSTANTVAVAKRLGGSSTQLQQTVADADAREKEALKDIEVQDNAFRTENKRNLENLMITKAGYEQKSQDAFNAARSALMGASEQNKYIAATNLGEAAVYAATKSNSGGAGGGASTSAASVSAPTASAVGEGAASVAGASATNVGKPLTSIEAKKLGSNPIITKRGTTLVNPKNDYLDKIWKQLMSIGQMPKLQQ